MNNCPICDSQRLCANDITERMSCRECGCEAPRIAWEQPRKAALNAQRYLTVRTVVGLADEDAKDAERLDFVLDNSAFIIATISHNADCDVTTYQLETQDEDENYITLSGDEKYFKSKREAIDAAIQAQGAKQI